jgi:hypothetical protein
MSGDEEGYNGWANRETWALNLWLSNDYGLYTMVRERVADVLDSIDYPHWVDEDDAADVHQYRANRVGEAVKDLWQELTDPDEQLMSAESILDMVRDIGSDYRVDWFEIGEAWLEDAEES